jgi:hypothetical protein
MIVVTVLVYKLIHYNSIRSPALLCTSCSNSKFALPSLYNLIEFSPNDQNTLELFVSIIKRTNIYIPSGKFVLNRSIPMEVRLIIHSHCHIDVNNFPFKFLIQIKYFPQSKVFSSKQGIARARLKMSRTFLPRVGPCLLLNLCCYYNFYFSVVSTDQTVQLSVEEVCRSLYNWVIHFPRSTRTSNQILISVLKSLRILREKVQENFLSNVSNILPPTTKPNNTFHSPIDTIVT